MSDTLSDKVAKLPTWARQLIQQLKLDAQPNRDTIRQLRLKIEHLEKANRKLNERHDAIMSIIEAANRGGHETAAALVEYVMREHTQYDE